MGQLGFGIPPGVLAFIQFKLVIELFGIICGTAAACARVPPRGAGLPVPPSGPPVVPPLVPVLPSSRWCPRHPWSLRPATGAASAPLLPSSRTPTPTAAAPPVLGIRRGRRRQGCPQTRQVSEGRFRAAQFRTRWNPGRVPARIGNIHARAGGNRQAAHVHRVHSDIRLVQSINGGGELRLAFGRQGKSRAENRSAFCVRELRGAILATSRMESRTLRRGEIRLRSARDGAPMDASCTLRSRLGLNGCIFNSADGALQQVLRRR